MFIIILYFHIYITAWHQSILLTILCLSVCPCRWWQSVCYPWRLRSVWHQDRSLAHGGVHVHSAGTGGRCGHWEQTLCCWRVSDENHSVDQNLLLNHYICVMWTKSDFYKEEALEGGPCGWFTCKMILSDVMQKLMASSLCPFKETYSHFNPRKNFFWFIYIHISSGMMAPQTSQPWSPTTPSLTPGNLRFPWEHGGAVWV